MVRTLELKKKSLVKNMIFDTIESFHIKYPTRGFVLPQFRLSFEREIQLKVGLMGVLSYGM
jgi:hypothetical protein